MSKELLKFRITEMLPSATFDESGEWLNVELTAEDWPKLAGALCKDNHLALDYMFCLTCIDWKTHLTMVYHLHSTSFRHNIVVKVKLDRNKPEVVSVCKCWRTAEFHEREVYEMFGVNFLHHPDLRLLILPDGWEGKNPLRKDFEDPINMIRL